MAKNKDDIVVFNRFNPETKQWEEVSNDPRWRAKRQLEVPSPDANQLAAEREAAVKAQIKSSEEAQSDSAPTESGENLSAMDGHELKTYAEKLGIDLAEVKKTNKGKLSKNGLIAAIEARKEATASVTITGADMVDLNQPAPVGVLGQDAEASDDEEETEDEDSEDSEDDEE